MYYHKLAALVGFGLEICAGAATVIWPEHIWIAKTTFVSGLVLIAGSVIYWLNEKYHFIAFQKKPEAIPLYSISLQHAKFPEQYHHVPIKVFRKDVLIDSDGNTHEDIYVRVQPREITELQDFNFRLLSSSGGNEVPVSVIRMTEIIDEVDGEPDRSNTNFTRKEDGKGGFNCHYEPPFRIKQGESLWFTVTLNIKKQWGGYLSFRWFDSEGKRKFVRQHIYFIEALLPIHRREYFPSQ